MNEIYRVEVRSPSSLSSFGRQQTEVVFRREDGDGNKTYKRYSPSDKALDLLDTLILFGLLRTIHVYLFKHYISLAYTRKEQT